MRSVSVFCEKTAKIYAFLKIFKIFFRKIVFFGKNDHNR